MVSVVRTESQLARFNTARALFEKLGVFDVKDAGDKAKDARSNSSRPASDNRNSVNSFSFTTSIDELVIH